ncbi:MAG: hypothetical protein PF690_04735 [Deltaproteobacteria bacterium]|jgi:hypothetical protein|nr:hypothetical protein [Deltaproteobacteria bacterium]
MSKRWVRAALLYEFAEVAVPCVKADHGNGLIGYLRFDKEFRNGASFEAFSCVPCRDHLLAVEFVNLKDGEIIQSSFSESGLIGKTTSDSVQSLNYVTNRTSEVAATLPMQLGAATHYTGSIYSAVTDRSPSGFIDELYRRVYRPWMDVAQAGPHLRFELKLPPLLAIVLNRSNFRRDVPTVLKELRGEMAPIRADLVRLNHMIDSCLEQSEIYAQTQRISESFDAVVAESLLTPVELRNRRIISIFNLIKPVRQIYSIAVDPLAADHEKFIEAFKSSQEAVKKNSRIISRSVAASKVSELLRIGSIRDMVTSHFTDEEQQLIHNNITNK